MLWFIAGFTAGVMIASVAKRVSEKTSDSVFSHDNCPGFAQGV